MPFATRTRTLLKFAIACGVFSAASLSSPVARSFCQLQPQQSQPQTQGAASHQNPPTDPAARKSADPASLPASAYAPRGKKLVMKDGSYQLVRSYEQKGDVVRYYSVERSQWEEIPSSLVDWDATTKSAEQDRNQADALISKVEKREAQQRATEVMDVDASLEVKPGVLLPPGEGLYLVADKSVTLLNEVRTSQRLDKGQAVKRVLVPVPIISAKHRMEIPGKRAGIRTTAHDPQFYLRIPYDSDQDPEVELFKAEVKGDTRLVEVISTNVVGENKYERKTLALERWNVAQGVFRFTLAEDLPPGEYAVAVILPEGINMYVWDFGVDPLAASSAKQH
jgi:hypothetical protein